MLASALCGPSRGLTSLASGALKKIHSILRVSATVGILIQTSVCARVGERLVDLGDDGGSFANRGRHALR